MRRSRARRRAGGRCATVDIDGTLLDALEDHFGRDLDGDASALAGAILEVLHAALAGVTRNAPVSRNLLLLDSRHQGSGGDDAEHEADAEE